MRIAPVAGSASSRGRELDPLRERPLYLRSMRAVLAVTIVIYAEVLPDQLAASLLVVVLISMAYLVTAFGLEMLSRWLTGGFYRWLFWLALGVDGAYLAVATYTSGGSIGPVRYLVLVYLTVITLLGTWQTGLATAAWQTIAQIGFYFAQRGGWLHGYGSSAVTGREGDQLAAFLAALWVLTVATAILAAINQGDLLRRRFELDRLVDMGGDMESADDSQTVGTLLLAALGDAFGFDRMVLFEVVQEIARPLATCGLVASAEDAEFVPDSVVQRAIATKRTIRLEHLDDAVDPWLAQFLPDARALAVVPLLADGVVGVLVVLLGPWAGRQSEQRIVATVERFASHAAIAMSSADLLARVRQLAITDGLTQLSNRRAFDRALDREIGRAARDDGRLSVVLIDLDNFKALNDEHGHVTGDTVLRQISRALQRSVRSYDTVARYGGEEFAAVLPGCSAGLAFTLADRLRLAIQDASSEVKVTASVGVATYPYDGVEAASLLRAADHALYASKRAGRNRVCSAERARVQLADR